MAERNEVEMTLKARIFTKCKCYYMHCTKSTTNTNINANKLKVKRLPKDMTTIRTFDSLQPVQIKRYKAR